MAENTTNLFAGALDAGITFLMTMQIVDNLKIIDGFEDTLRETEQILGLRGILKKKN